MAVVWIVTTGNSDVKLTSDHQWGYLREQKRDALKPCYKDFKSPTEDDDGLFSLPARVMGIVYGDALDTHWQYFHFPLLSEFTREIKANTKNSPNQIIVLLTDQTKAFQEDNQTDRLSDPDCHYWKDTTRLEPILKHYFDQEFGSGKVQFYDLKPKSLKEGLDNWESALQLVQEKFSQWKISENDRIIVSYQASTPAISSAVQFISLAKFGERVKFLVSNERDAALTRFLPSSAYLKGIRQQEAKALLKSYDYSGIQKLISPYLDDEHRDDEHRETKLLLNAAIQWNYAKFEEFASKLQHSSDQKLAQEVKERSQHWWWTAYEAAYLAWIRLEQGNTVEALFHSFRAAEGLISNWAKWYYPEDIKETKNGAPIAKHRANSHLPTYLTEKLFEIKNQELLLHSEELFKLFKETRPEITENEDVKVIWNGAKNIRNQQFHRLLGLNEREVFRAWGTKENRPAWKSRLRNCLNTIAEQTFESLEEASLMAKVHQELENAIASL